MSRKYETEPWNYTIDLNLARALVEEATKNGTQQPWQEMYEMTGNEDYALLAFIQWSDEQKNYRGLYQYGLPPMAFRAARRELKSARIRFLSSKEKMKNAEQDVRYFYLRLFMQAGAKSVSEAAYLVTDSMYPHLKDRNEFAERLAHAYNQWKARGKRKIRNAHIKAREHIEEMDEIQKQMREERNKWPAGLSQKEIAHRMLEQYAKHLGKNKKVTKYSWE